MDAPAQAVTDVPQRVARLDAWLERKRVEQAIPGMAVAVVVGDEVVLLGGYGVADLETGRAVDEHTLFALGSCTKVFTSVLGAMAVEAGVVRWEDPVSMHLPQFDVKVTGAPQGTRVTLQDVFSHRTGFGRLPWLWANRPTPLREVLQAANSQTPVAPYRSRWQYSNVMYAAGGEAVARALGGDWHAVIRRRLLEPLGMTSTHTWQSQSRDDPARSQGYIELDPGPGHRPMPWIDRQGIAPAGSIDSTAADMAAWVRFLVEDGVAGDQRLVGTEALERTWQPQVDLAPGESYATGWFVRDWNGHRLVDHPGGGDHGHFCQIALMPDHDMGFALLGNVKWALLQHEARKGVFAILLGEDPPQMNMNE